LVGAAETARAGAALAAIVKGGETIALVGELGVGKTTFVAGFVAALGGGAASSPTFALVNIYAGGRLRVVHADLYRLEAARELVELGLDDEMGDPRTVCLVEWADKFPGVLPPGAWRIDLAHAGDARVLTSALEPQLLASMP
jgi:tRNA threonylcarbamoyladenosine biosynthesis protein TsaE